MAGTIAAPPDPFSILLGQAGNLAGLFTDKKTNTTSSIDPEVMAQTSQLYNTLLNRGTTTDATDSVVQDIIYRTQLAFSDVLGQEKGAGAYNSTTKKLLADNATAQAVRASATAVLQDQQSALKEASGLQANLAQATKKTSVVQPAQIGMPQIMKLLAPALALKAGSALKDKLKSKTPPTPPVDATADAVSSATAGDAATADAAATATEAEGATVQGTNAALSNFDIGASELGTVADTTAATIPASALTANDLLADDGISTITADTGLGDPGQAGVIGVASTASLSDAGVGLFGSGQAGVDAADAVLGTDFALPEGVTAADALVGGGATDAGTGLTGAALDVGAGVGLDALVGGGAVDAGIGAGIDVAAGDGLVEALGKAALAVICTELHAQKIMSDDLYNADLKFSRAHIDPATLRGYHFWARPYANLMRRSPLATQLIKPFAFAWINQVGYDHTGTTNYKNTLFGRTLRCLGEPICFCIGKLISPSAVQPKVA